jgi:hypothetical protein
MSNDQIEEIVSFTRRALHEQNFPALMKLSKFFESASQAAYELDGLKGVLRATEKSNS